MSTNSIYNYDSSYNSTTSLLSSLYGSSSSSVGSSGLTSSVYGSSSYGSYGVNTSTASSSLSSYLVGIKQAAANIGSAVDTAQDKSTWNKISYNSDSSSVSVSYTGDKELGNMTVDVKALAKSQVNEGKKLEADARSSVNSTSFSITMDDGTKKDFFVATGSSLSNKEVQQKVADKINSSKLGVTASVETDSKGKSRLVLTGKSGEENGFNVSGALAEDLGITTVSQKAQDAVYSINSGPEQKSSTNKIEINDNLTLSLKSVTEKTANLTYSKDLKKGINAAREFVNSFNALYDKARGYEDSGASKLQNRLTSLTSAYSKSLSRIGIGTDENGYLKIDEEKMQKAAENGDLEKFFTKDAGQNYGFVNRIDILANQVNSDPSKFLSSSGKEELKSENSSSSSYYPSSYTDLMGSASFRKSYFNYITTSALFDALF